jgi:hypothetical protein
VFNTETTVVQVTDNTGAYTADNARIVFWTNTNDTTNGANGSNICFRVTYYVADHSWDDSINVTLNMRADIVYPESTYLTTNAWGTPSWS